METSTRQEYIRAAISFLQNPKLIDSSLKDKLQFLRDKGLTETEVDEALNLALVNRQSTRTAGRWNFFLVFSVCILGYRFYKAYLEWKETQVQSSTGKQDQNVQALTKNISTTQHVDSKLNLYSTNDQLGLGRSNDVTMTVSEIVQRVSELKSLLEYQGDRFSSEIKSLKTLLLSHEKFAAPPVIPAWQLEGTKEEDSPKKESSEKEKELSERENEMKS